MHECVRFIGARVADVGAAVVFQNFVVWKKSMPKLVPCFESSHIVCCRLCFRTREWQMLVEQERNNNAVIPAFDTWDVVIVDEWQVNGETFDDEAAYYVPQYVGKVVVWESDVLFQTLLGTAARDSFGKCVALSAVTHTLLVGADGVDSD